MVTTMTGPSVSQCTATTGDARWYWAAQALDAQLDLDLVADHEAPGLQGHAPLQIADATRRGASATIPGTVAH
jgi:hypothetical protein